MTTLTAPPKQSTVRASVDAFLDRPDLSPLTVRAYRQASQAVTSASSSPASPHEPPTP